MRLTESQVKDSILSLDQDVRGAAVFYFAQAYSADPGIMPLAIQAVEQYCWKDAFDFYSFMADLAQTDETVLWLVAQIKKHSVADEEYGYPKAIRSALIHAEAAILERHQAEILNLDELEG